MEGWWPIFFMAVILKIPVAALLYIVWWAVKTDDQAVEETGDDGGFRRHRSTPPRPRGPRRGPHGPDAVALPDCPPGGRTRVVRPEAVPVLRRERASSR